MRVKREELLAVLESVRPGLSVKEVLEQTNCFLFLDGRVVTFNEEVSCSAPLDLGGLRLAVPAKPLFSVLHKMPDDEVTVTANPTEGGTELLVRGKGKRKVGIRTQTEIHLSLPFSDALEWRKLPEDYGDAVGLVQECAGKDVKKFATHCVHLHPKWVEAFDGSQMMRYRIKTGLSAPTLVKREALRHIAVLMPSQFAEEKSWIHYRNDAGLVVSCRRFQEEYFPLGDNIKLDGAPVTLPKGLGAAAEIAEVFSGEKADDNLVTVSLRPGEVGIRGEGVSGWYSEVRAIKYDGPRMTFIISPKLLREVTSRYNEALLSETRLKVNGGRWRYICCLAVIPNGKE